MKELNDLDQLDANDSMMDIDSMAYEGSLALRKVCQSMHHKERIFRYKLRHKCIK